MVKKVYVRNIDDYILVDDQDYERVNAFLWHITYAHQTRRCLAFIEGKKVALPKYITGVNHAYQKEKNLDFTRQNIGIDAHKYRYRQPQKNSSCPYKGVSYHKSTACSKKYRAMISLGDRQVFLGYFETDKEAAHAYNQAVVKYWNGNGYMNDI
ncbi:AP2 domain-containing protein [Staphylococcus massiliensis]|uniref:AP2/ERF domain-containing protein n=1 Tax=Staphylococcus massiliensis S46 TaxID=1229783 RepID=K9ARH9_9STAP|nr:AP2 domain-containing protein [Staphylococcus massiliensis]EKU50043.1 hypothetical protein C273_02203 [Staphylococcus massiliensis S46]MCG3399198.1 AP2 domain-containing protein [Staphylococcus massiliensis]MCG3402250.1 AP2 domain-containing protein [Staphylococcus massiliensis]MCG3412783.1 AP2 domain-containing protein [Staphylococcus massiliensis]POA00720.1 AP2 domain-containing protein [Staphylococcus massiliensis CCUG 55927]